MIKVIPKIDDLLIVNGNNFSDVDYVNYIANISTRPLDLLLSFERVFFPEFKKIDDLIFNISFGCYNSYIKNVALEMSRDEAYYWANVVDLCETFLIEERDANKIAENMVFGWNESLRRIGEHHMKFEKKCNDGVFILPVV